MSGAAYFFTFPFWIYAEKTDDWKPKNIHYKGKEVRVFPPFRSGTHAFNGTPPLLISNVPLSPEEKTADHHLSLRAMNSVQYPRIPQDGGSWKSIKVAVSNGDLPDEPMNEEKMNEFFGSGGRAFDSLRVDIYENDEHGRSLVEEAVRVFLELIRLTTYQWWILRSIDPLVGYCRGGARLNEDNRLSADPFGALHSNHVFGFERNVTPEVWERRFLGLLRIIGPIVLIACGLTLLGTQSLES